jgi:hypothetical protein
MLWSALTLAQRFPPRSILTLTYQPWMRWPRPAKRQKLDAAKTA